jgi:hypothetical protein
MADSSVRMAESISGVSVGDRFSWRTARAAASSGSNGGGGPTGGRVVVTATSGLSRGLVPPMV